MNRITPCTCHSRILAQPYRVRWTKLAPMPFPVGGHSLCRLPDPVTDPATDSVTDSASDPVTEQVSNPVHAATCSFVVYGGADAFGRVQTAVQVFSLIRNTWTVQLLSGSPSNSTAGHIATEQHGNLFVFGGQHMKIIDSEQQANIVDTLTVLTRTDRHWSHSTHPAGPARNGSVGVRTVDGRWFMHGGSGPEHDESENTTEILPQSNIFDFDFQKCQWRLLETHGEVPEARELHAATAIDSKTIVIVAGRGHNAFLNDMYALKLDTLKWVRIGSAPTRAAHSLFFLNEMQDENKTPVLIFGGTDGHDFMHDVLMYMFHQASVHSGSHAEESQADDAIEKSDLCANCGGLRDWVELDESCNENVPPGRFAHAAAMVDHNIYLITGGVNQDGALSDTWLLEIVKNT